MTIIDCPPPIAAQARRLALQQRRGDGELNWNRRLSGLGYAVRRGPGGRVLTTLPHGVVVCDLPGP
ncbi:MAG: hypothetical protein ACU0BF_13205 [Paracoccaceae bacterium]